MNALEDAGGLRAARLAATLLDRGLLDEPWAEAFAATPRHRFLPKFYQRDHDEWNLITAETVGRRRWLELAYHDVTWVQRLAGPNHHDEGPACSCLQPSLAARLLTRLPALPRARICEIGTGTGWLTGLLCHRYGSDRVVGIELDPDLVEQARSALAALCLGPRLLCGDGFYGHPESAPYDAILSTAATTYVPRTWLDQVSAGGRIITPLRGGIAVIDIVNTDKAIGRFLPDPVQILPLRTLNASILRASPRRIPTTDSADGAVGASLRNPQFRFFLGLLHPDLVVRDSGLLGDLTVTDPTGSQVRIDALGKTTAKSTSHMWELLCSTYSTWERAKRPGPTDITLELSGGRQWAFTSRSSSGKRWQLY